MLGNIVFFTPERLAEMWGYVKTLLSMVSPAVMIAIAIIGVGILLVVIIKAFKDAAAPKEKSDDEIEFRHY